MYILIMMKNSIKHPAPIIGHEQYPHGPMTLPGDVCVDVTDIVPEGVDVMTSSVFYDTPSIQALIFWYAAVVGIPPQDVRYLIRNGRW